MATAAPIVAEGAVRVRSGDVISARRAALNAALAQALRLVIERHVPRSEIEARSKELKEAFFSPPGSYIQRYAVASERSEADSVRVSVEAQVDRQKVLAELRDRGFAVLTLTAAPRILMVPLGGGAASAAADALREAFEAEEFRARVYPGNTPARVDESTVSGWAQILGCHVALPVEVRAGRLRDASEESGVAPAGPPEEDAPELSRAAVVARGWLVDARTEQVLGRSEARGVGSGPDVAQASTRGGARAGHALAYPLLAALEQSGWSPGGESGVVDLRVEDLPDPSLVEELQGELLALTEVQGAELREVGYRSAMWRVEVVEAGLGWEAVLAAVRLGRGGLAWRGIEEPEADGEPQTVWAAWVPR